jgi:uncharacterized protein YggE
MLASICVLLIGATTADTDENSKFTRLSLSGVGQSEQVSEFVTIGAATETWSRSPSSAMQANASDMERLRSRLSQLGVAKADFRTSGFRFNKAGDPSDHDGDRDDGFAVNHQLAIVIRDTEKVGRIMDALVDAGAKNLAVDRGWGYSGDVDPGALKKARALAISDAMTKAEDYAAALGMKVRRVVSVEDRQAYANDRPMVMARIDAGASATQIETRPQTVLASVGIEFELEK